MSGGNTDDAKQVDNTSFVVEASPVESLRGYGEGYSEGNEYRTRNSVSHQEPQVVPSNTIIVREIPNPVDSNALKQFFNHSFGPVRDVRIPQSQFSTRSKSYGFVEFVRVETAQKVVEKAVNGGVIYQGSKLEITFASDGFENKGWDCLACGYANFARRRICKKCGAKKEINDILGSSQSKFVAGDAVLAARWTASSQGLMEYSPYSKYCLDPTSGWYYDPQTLYYVVDAINLIFFDSSRQIYLQYNPTTGTYVEYATNVVSPPKDSDSVAACSNPSSDNVEQTVHEEPVETKVDSIKSDVTNIAEQESAKDRKANESQITKSKVVVTPIKPRGRILSNIQRWNQRRIERQEVLKEFEEEHQEEEEEEEKNHEAGNIATEREEEQPIQSLNNNNLDVNQTEEDKLIENDSNTERYSKMTSDTTEQTFICNLCRRKFKSSDILEKHTQYSQLHRTNLQKQNSMYRDRAAERRQLHPVEDDNEIDSGSNIPKMNSARQKKKRPISTKKTPVHEPLDIENNIGAKLMKCMGWKEGQGLGREASGITAPISAVANRGQSGLGAEPLNDPELHIHPTDNPKERLRKETMLRWKMKFGEFSNDH